MLRRRKADLRKDLEKIAQARRAAEEAAARRAKVESSNSEIMREVKAHREILRKNNFADRWRAALGGEGT